ncbi:MAG: hypothetical protein JNL58_23030 [Planctomyces sp.]|nr:hypothetical protein [Planctomyces sp.]
MLGNKLSWSIVCLGFLFAAQPITAIQPPEKLVPQDKNPTNTPKPLAPVPEEDPEKPAPLKPLPPQLAELIKDATSLNPDGTVFLDVKGKRAILRTEVACTNCILEMLCVPEGIKEHETILRLRSKAWVVHTALVGMGVEPGKPATFSPEFIQPSGTTIRIYASWVDADGKLQRQDVRSWMRHNIHRYFAAPLKSPPPGLELPYKELRYDRFNNEVLWYGPMSEQQRDDLLSKWDNPDYIKAISQFFEQSKSRQMTAEFVFAGSGFYKDPESGKEFYQAEGGFLICVANFADAMIDVREASTSSDGSQTYEAWTEKIPPENTPVLLELVPVPEQPNAAENVDAVEGTDSKPEISK